ncbi:putative Ntn-hydrolase superfamily protein [Mesorhizobium soli]|uniref:DUF1028 domain-containing protein n=1 Tax=Pseudaminobacter soli (ex Li et al. 2025) TaxID=1295366 RepID=UPI002474159D|nr:DUF1028 domain-containing protein [Mesorhizobium soli]MDH6233753.1 putative Ntn-hydrolase superfamily protein [Mesorhizobium soli]
MIELNTFSISARCNVTGMLGVAVSTAVPAVGGLCPFIKADVGTIATQAWVNPYLGIDGVKLLESGCSAEETLHRLIDADPEREVRQLGIVDAQGRSSAFTGKDCVGWAGHIVGDGYTVQGNMLVGAATIEKMAAAADELRSIELPERLMRVLEAGQSAGGDKRGKQSAALKVYHREAFPWLDIRVDEHPDPVAELRRVFEIASRQLLPFTRGMPSRADPRGALAESVTAMLMLPPEHRPGSSRS